MLEMMFRISCWVDRSVRRDVVASLAREADGSVYRQFSRGAVRWIVEMLDEDLAPECDDLFAGWPTIALELDDPVDVDDDRAANHVAVANSIASIASDMPALPAVTAVECYSIDAHQIVAWMADGSWFVPRYEYTGGPPRSRYIDEMREVYRPAVIRELDGAGVSCAEPVFDHRWAIDETHRFIETP